MPQLIPSIVQAVILICQTLLSNMDQFLSAAGAIITGLATGLINALPQLIAALPQIISAIITFITNNLPVIVQMGLKITLQLAAGIIRAIPQLVAAVPRLIAALVRGLGQAVVSVAQIGKNIVTGLWNGIASMASWIYAKVQNFFSGIVAKAKRVLGIHSPSKVFAGIGENMGAGIGVGFTDAMTGVQKDMEKAIPTDFNLDMSTVMTGAVTPVAAAQAFNVTIPLTLDGSTLTKIISQIQWSQNAVSVRNLGTV